MRLLVTGGAGFIGSHFIKYMSKRYPLYRIKNLDSLTYAGNLSNLIEVEKNVNYTLVNKDITDFSGIEPIFREGIDVVVNIAAETHVDRSIADPTLFIKTNVLGTQVLLDLSLKFGITKFVQISTDEVYGTLGKDGLFTEESPLAPNSPYSASKAGADLLVRSYHETYGLPINITRCSNNYGPNQYPEKLIPLMISKAVRNEALPVYGDGLNIRDWLYVEDHCSAIDKIIHEGLSGEIYNIGGNNERTNIEVIRNILAHLNKSDSLISYVKDRLGHDRRYAIDSSKIQAELGWKPEFIFESSIKNTIDWYVEELGKITYNK